MVGNGGGLAYSALGPTHLAVDDISILRIIPSMTVVAVSDKQEMKNLMKENYRMATSNLHKVRFLEVKKLFQKKKNLNLEKQNL